MVWPSCKCNVCKMIEDTFNERSYEIINESIFVSATKIGENTTNILNCCFSQ